MQNITVKAQSLNGLPPTPQYEMLFEIQVEDECPICNRGIDMKHSYHNYHDAQSADQRACNVVCVHVCPSCHQAFITYHWVCRRGDVWKETDQSVYPIPSKDLGIPKKIEQISKQFVAIYRDVTIAKEYHLVTIYGMALRKALECLIKDYALYKNPDQEKEIGEKGLRGCINQYISDEKLKLLANSCRLIGNNETHWKNENTREDVMLMERVIDAILSYIQTELTVDDARRYIEEHN